MKPKENDLNREWKNCRTERELVEEEEETWMWVHKSFVVQLGFCPFWSFTAW